jgi:ATPase subunit of ABC transporter with duplicated ATPase domains
VGHVEVAHVSHDLPDERLLLDDASFRIGEGEGVTAALVGPNGAGKTTLAVSGDLQVGRSGGIGGCRGVGSQGEQSAGNIGAGSTVRNLLISTAPPRVQAASQLLDAVGSP